MKFVTPLLAVCVLATALSSDAQAQACLTQPLSGGGYANTFTTNFRNAADGDFFDYALILQDAKRRDCSIPARDALLTKVTNTLNSGTRPHHHVGTISVGPYQNWLEGATVSYALAAALAIGGHGDLTSTLDAKLQQMITYYNTNPSTAYPYFRYGININCGVGKNWQGETSDTCMEEHAIGATGHAWAAAYQQFRGNTASRDTNRTKAKAAINDSFRLTELNGLDSICLHDPQKTMSATNRGPCNVTNDLDIYSALTRTSPAPAHTFAMNRGQNQVYGFGLLASISSAALALELSGEQWYPNGDQKLLMQAMLEEAQSKAHPTYGDYFNGHLGGTGNCTVWSSSGASVVGTSTYPCADTMHRPRMYPLVKPVSGGPATTFFSKYLPTYTPKTTVTDRVTGAVINNAFQFNRFSFSDFALNPPADGSKPHFGRAIGYGTLAYYWHTPKVANDTFDSIAPAAGELRPRMTGVLDDNDAIGHFDGISATGVATGWTCDKDWPAKSIYVEMYWDSPIPHYTTWIGSYKANVSHEPAVTTACNGGLAHRFSVQLPTPAYNRAVYIYGADATWRGATLLSASFCTGGVCRW